jgi:hypothetical protein
LPHLICLSLISSQSCLHWFTNIGFLFYLALIHFAIANWCLAHPIHLASKWNLSQIFTFSISFLCKVHILFSQTMWLNQESLDRKLFEFIMRFWKWSVFNPKSLNYCLYFEILVRNLFQHIIDEMNYKSNC